MCVDARPTAQPALTRAITRWELVALSLNEVVVSGVYLRRTRRRDGDTSLPKNSLFKG